MRVLADRERQSRGGYVPEYLRSHPEPVKRVVEIESTARKLREAGLKAVDVSAPEVSTEAMFGKVPTLAPSACPYMAAVPGQAWEYEVRTPDATTRYRIRCVGVADVGLTPVARMEVDLGDAPVAYQAIFVGDRVWRRNRPGKVGSPWSIEMAFPEEGAALEAGRKIVAFEALEDVETPAGRFGRCLKVRIEEDGKRKATEWYAPGVGLLRRESEASGVVETLIALKRP